MEIAYPFRPLQERFQFRTPKSYAYVKTQAPACESIWSRASLQCISKVMHISSYYADLLEPSGQIS